MPDGQRFYHDDARPCEWECPSLRADTAPLPTPPPLRGTPPTAAAVAQANATVRAFFAAVNQGRGAQAATYVHPAAAAAERLLQLTDLLNQIEARTMELDAHYHLLDHPEPAARIERELREHGRRPVRPWNGVATVAQAMALPPSVLVAGELQASHRARTLKPSFTGYQLVGVVVETDSVAHALFRDPEKRRQDGGGELWTVEVRREGGRWAVFPTRNLLETLPEPFLLPGDRTQNYGSGPL
jgi:hypothetical protein